MKFSHLGSHIDESHSHAFKKTISLHFSSVTINSVAVYIPLACWCLIRVITNGNVTVITTVAIIITVACITMPITLCVFAESVALSAINKNNLTYFFVCHNVLTMLYPIRFIGSNISSYLSLFSLLPNLAIRASYNSRVTIFLTKSHLANIC